MLRRLLRLKTEETPVFCVCKQKQEFIATEAIYRVLDPFKGRVFSNSIVFFSLTRKVKISTKIEAASVCFVWLVLDKSVHCLKGKKSDKTTTKTV